MHSSRMSTARSSSRRGRGGLPQCMSGCGSRDTPWVWAPSPGQTLQLPPSVWACRTPPLARPLNFPPGCGPGNLQGMLGYHLQCMLGYIPPGVGLETPQVWGLETPLARPLNFPQVWAWKPARHAGIPPLPVARYAGIPPAMNAGIYPPGCGTGPINFPPGCWPGNLQSMLRYHPPLQGMLGYHLQCMLGYHPPVKRILDTHY